MCVCFSVPLDLDVRMKAVLIGALFVIVSALLYICSEKIYLTTTASNLDGFIN